MLSEAQQYLIVEQDEFGDSGKTIVKKYELEYTSFMTKDNHLFVYVGDRAVAVFERGAWDRLFVKGVTVGRTSVEG